MSAFKAGRRSGIIFMCGWGNGEEVPMVRFPEFMNRHHKNSKEGMRERELAMRGWRDQTMKPRSDFASLRHLPAGMGRHFVRSEIARGRGQTKFKG